MVNALSCGLTGDGGESELLQQPALDDVMRFEILWRKVIRALRKNAEIVSGGSSQEGAMSFHLAPCRDGMEKDMITLELAAGLLGPPLHYRWEGKSLAACLDLAESDIERLLKESNEPEREERVQVWKARQE